MKCPVCEGNAGWNVDYGGGTVLHEDCSFCHDTGRVWPWKWVSYHFWQNVPEWVIEFIYEHERRRAATMQSRNAKVE